MTELFKQLTDIFREVFDDDAIVLNETTTADDIDGWDSLSHVNLIVTVESRFNLRFSHKEILAFRHVGDLMAAIEARRG